jgi:hypothetical protein
MHRHRPDRGAAVHGAETGALGCERIEIGEIAAHRQAAVLAQGVRELLEPHVGRGQAPSRVQIGTRQGFEAVELAEEPHAARRIAGLLRHHPAGGERCEKEDCGAHAQKNFG